MLSLIASLFRRRPLARRYAVLAVPGPQSYRYLVLDVRHGYRFMEADRATVLAIVRSLNDSRRAVAR